MCGIAGIFAIDDATAARNLTCDAPPDGQSPLAGELNRMLDTMPYRGPDARGIDLCGGRAGLGHLRLSILDLRPESNQPFAIDDGQYVVTYNGEIFNYVELRAELEAAGCTFRTASDTEVLVRAYAQWGPDCVRRFNGMWALAIYDRTRDVLFCSRDRFGIKPLNYAVHRGRFLFASEIKAILAVAPELARPNYASLSRLLRASIGARLEETCFDSIKRLLPAHNLTVSRYGVKLERYWDYPTEVDTNITPADAAEALRQHLIESLRLRMRSDVPVGITLSGGVDSSSIACLLRTFCRDPLETFTASFPGESFDEAPAAGRLAESLGLHANPVPVEARELLPALREIVRHLEAPIHTPAVLPLWSIMRAARPKVTVLLEGQGADELLAGYYTNFATVVADRVRRGRLRAAAEELGWELRRVGPRRALLLAGRAAGPLWSHRLFRQLRGDESVYRGPLAGGPADEPPLPNRPPIADRLNASLRQQHEGRLVDLLHYGDVISMAHSIESRLPFLDHRLVEFCFRLPGELKYRHGHGKAILKQAVRGDVPAAVLDNRRKLGFVVPIARWFRQQPAETIEPVLLSERCRDRGLFDAARLQRALAAHRAGRVDLSNNIYRWIMTELWFEEFID
ncbi:MAG: asparagine synthase (glutamine-hydrolyzing) [Pirellulales bacterium]|nr:asparagine synthase (glutamine-hydrolyzing) [Pirellulales bacterium]